MEQNPDPLIARFEVSPTAALVHADGSPVTDTDYQAEIARLRACVTELEGAYTRDMAEAADKFGALRLELEACEADLGCADRCGREAPNLPALWRRHLAGTLVFCGCGARLVTAAMVEASLRTDLAVCDVGAKELATRVTELEEREGVLVAALEPIVACYGVGYKKDYERFTRDVGELIEEARAALATVRG